ncbi:MAG: hypothetical protein ACXW3X_15075 [Rhodoplanes sp.]
MISYHSDGFRPIRHDEKCGIDGPRAAAAAFAARMAHREFGQRGHCRTIRLDSSSRDGMHSRYEAFISAPTERRTTAGHNVWIEIDIKHD